MTPPAMLVGAVSLLVGQKTHPALDAAVGWHPAMFLPHQPLLWSLFATLGIGMGGHGSLGAEVTNGKFGGWEQMKLECWTGVLPCHMLTEGWGQTRR